MEKNSEHYKKGNFLVKSQKKKKQPFGVERVEDFFGFAFFFFPQQIFDKIQILKIKNKTKKR